MSLTLQDLLHAIRTDAKIVKPIISFGLGIGKAMEQQK